MYIARYQYVYYAFVCAENFDFLFGDKKVSKRMKTKMFRSHEDDKKVSKYNEEKAGVYIITVCAPLEKWR